MPYFWYQHGADDEEGVQIDHWGPRGKLTRDDLIRLVVGMQWQAAMMCVLPNTAKDDDGKWQWLFGAFIHLRADVQADDLPAASTIVDEWLGVR